MRLLYCLMMLCSLADLPAQDTYFARLAGEVCSCMERFSVEPINRQATNCLREVAQANEESLYKRYSLVVADATQRDLLAERLAGDLLRDCPLLATLNYETEEELRWSDRERLPIREPLQFQSPKGPPADQAESVTGESPIEWLAEGSVERLAGGKMFLRQPSGKAVEFDLPAGLSRLHRIKRGDELKLSFRREWRKGESRVVNVVIDVKD